MKKPSASAKSKPRRAAVLAELAKRIRLLAPYDGSFDLRLPALHLTRRSKAYGGAVRDLQRPALCIVAQGAKTAMLGPEAYTYDAAEMVVFSVDLPLGYQLSRVSVKEPYLGLRVDLDAARLADLAQKVYPHGIPKAAEQRGIMLCPTDAEIVRAAVRLLELMSRPDDVELLAPLLVDEIYIRLLRSPVGPRVARLGFAKSGLPGVAKAVAWLGAHFDQPVKVEALADVAAMSLSSFHHHFKSVTAMSPVQYQKLLRLQEARRLMLNEVLDAGSAAQRVGYLSPSQFTREYGRLFGLPPAKDAERVRSQMGLSPARKEPVAHLASN